MVGLMLACLSLFFSPDALRRGMGGMDSEPQPGNGFNRVDVSEGTDGTPDRPWTWYFSGFCGVGGYVPDAKAARRMKCTGQGPQTDDAIKKIFRASPENRPGARSASGTRRNGAAWPAAARRQSLCAAIGVGA